MASRLLLSLRSNPALRREILTGMGGGSTNSMILKRSLSSLPYHLVVGMPALSPTMDAGSLAEWYVGEGDSFTAGDALAKIETDKASIDFEAQDDGYVAKLLKSAGEGSDIKVGVPIMVTVEEEEDVAAFADFVLPAEDAAPPAAAAEEATPPPAAPKEEAAAPPPPPPPPAAVAAAPEPVAAAAAPVVEAPPVVAAAASSVTPAWGSMVSTSSPLAKTLASQQQAYLEMYGTTGQRPLLEADDN